MIILSREERPLGLKEVEGLHKLGEGLMTTLKDNAKLVCQTADHIAVALDVDDLCLTQDWEPLVARRGIKDVDKVVRKGREELFLGLGLSLLLFDLRPLLLALDRRSAPRQQHCGGRYHDDHHGQKHDPRGRRPARGLAHLLRALSCPFPRPLLLLLLPSSVFVSTSFFEWKTTTMMMQLFLSPSFLLISNTTSSS